MAREAHQGFGDTPVLLVVPHMEVLAQRLG